jgi:hypothetical protein
MTNQKVDLTGLSAEQVIALAHKKEAFESDEKDYKLKKKGKHEGLPAEVANRRTKPLKPQNLK